MNATGGAAVDGAEPVTPDALAPYAAVSTGWRVPAHVEAEGEVVTVTRAWPGKPTDDGMRVTVEGPDRHGRLRAGSVERGGRVRLLPPGVDPKLPALDALAAGRELLVHRAGRRAVLRHDGGYTKVVRPGRSAAVASAASTGRALVAAAGLAAPEVLRHDARLGTVTMSVLPGRPVHELSQDPAWERVWTGWVQAWVRLQGLDPRRLEQDHLRFAGEAGRPQQAGRPLLVPHTAADEAEVLRGWLERTAAAGLLPQVWQTRADSAQRLLRLQGDPARLVPTHRDLHDKQLLWDGAGLGVLDLDTACVADPALDPANLAVHADLRRAQSLWSASAAETVDLSARLVARAAGVDHERWRTAQLATVARLVCVYAFRPAWRDVVLEWGEQRWAALGER